MIDLGRSVITVNLGIRDVDPAAILEAGGIVDLDSLGRIIKSAGSSAPYGVCKWNKTSAIYGAVVSESVTLTGEDVISLAHPLLVAGSVRVYSGGTTYTVTTDYLVNTTNGTLARVATGSIGDGDTVSIDYRYQLSADELLLRGTNYTNSLDDTAGSGKMTVIQDFAEIYTDQFDTSVAYTMDCPLYIGSGGKVGLFTSSNSSGIAFGKCIKIPTAADPILGVQIGR
jgi:hypothetical protein